MEKGFLDKVEDNAAVRTWSEITQREKGDSLDDGQLFYTNYGDLPYLLDVKVDKHLFRPSPSLGILLTVVSHLERSIWCQR
ncbi:hypothetical protein Golax_000018 [Gossypium laxum]|uniref:Uncharacterized protein n=1 Tax=Gossypium laxum TaxID=34288 RepID=A0A7J9AZI4_9ROSI|nr:hypothetical protein [Gossypium laxum]